MNAEEQTKQTTHTIHNKLSAKQVTSIKCRALDMILTIHLGNSWFAEHNCKNKVRMWFQLGYKLL